MVRDIFNDYLYRECIKLAMNSKGDMIRFGSLLLKEGKIIGKGWNRRADKRFPINMGYANHAEIMAMNDALIKGFDIKDCEIYVGGYFPSDNTQYIPKKTYFTCTKCPIYFAKYGIRKIFVHSDKGWKGLFLAHAVYTARNFISNCHEKRIELGKSNVSIDNIF